MQKAAMSGKGLFGSLSSGFKAVVGGFRTGSLSVMASITGIGVSLSAILLPLAAIGAAAFTLKKMWDLNIGGMQTKFMQLFGSLKTAWGKFNAVFARSLQKLSPLFNVVLSPIFAQLKFLFAVFEGVFKGIFAVISPIIDIFGEIGKTIEDVFGLSSEGKMFTNVLKGIVAVLGGIGKTVGFLLKVLLSPIKLGLHMIRVYKKLGKIIGSVFKNKALDMFGDKISSVVKIIIGAKNIFIDFKNAVINSILGIWNKIVRILDKIPDVFLPESLQNIKTSNSPATQASNNNVSNKTVNNNQNVTFNTSRPTSPNMASAFTDAIAKQLIVD